jgi:hypothetical protein
VPHHANTTQFLSGIVLAEEGKLLLNSKTATRREKIDKK